MIQQGFMLLWKIKGTQIAREVIDSERQARENLRLAEDMNEQRAELNVWINSEPECLFSNESNGAEYDGGGGDGDSGDGDSWICRQSQR
jgi:hypothetical protein